MTKYGYVVVEGPHDVEFVARVLKVYGFQRVLNFSDLDDYWTRLVPTSFPPNGDLLKRVPVPLFVQNDTYSIAIHSAMGIDRIVERIEESIVLIDRSELTSIAVVLDSDLKVDPSTRYTALREKIRPLGVNLPEQPGEIAVNELRAGVFVLPDNNSMGTLEDVLLDCASVVYPSLLNGAEAFVAGVDLQGDEFVQKDREDFGKPAGRKKAIISCISGILRPGKAIQVSIQDNRWLDTRVHNRPLMHAIFTFFEGLFELPQLGGAAD